MFLICCPVAIASALQFDRIDLISEERGMWINHEASAMISYPTRGAIRWINQVKAVWNGPWEQTYIGMSISTQSLVIEYPIIKKRLYATTGIQSQLLLPNGFLVGGAWRYEGFRIGLGLSATSAATWSRPSYDHWTVLPTIGIGYGQN